MTDEPVQREPVPAPWMEYAKAEEKQRLALLEARVLRKKKTLDELLTERRKIMMRCIRRKRREQGVE